MESLARNEQHVSKRRVNLVSHNASLRRLIFLYHLKDQMVQLHPWLHYTFKEISNDTSHAQVRVKMKEGMTPISWRRKQIAEQNPSCQDTKQVVATLVSNLS